MSCRFCRSHCMLSVLPDPESWKHSAIVIPCVRSSLCGRKMCVLGRNIVAPNLNSFQCLNCLYICYPTFDLQMYCYIRWFFLARSRIYHNAAGHQKC